MRGDRHVKSTPRPTYFAVQRIERLHERLGKTGQQLAARMAREVINRKLDDAAETQLATIPSHYPGIIPRAYPFTAG